MIDDYIDSASNSYLVDTAPAQVALGGWGHVPSFYLDLGFISNAFLLSSSSCFYLFSELELWTIL